MGRCEQYFEKANKESATTALIPSPTMKAWTFFTAVMVLLLCGFDATAYGQKTVYLTFDTDMDESL